MPNKNIKKRLIFLQQIFDYTMSKYHINSNLVKDEKSFKIYGESTHFPPTNKEWSNSVYSYNKSYTRTLPVKDDTLYKLIEGYFNLNDSKVLARSRRMRSLKLKNSSKRLFIAKPQIKQANDKVVVTVYTYNREKHLLLKKISLHSKNFLKKASKEKFNTHQPTKRVKNYPNFLSKRFFSFNRHRRMIISRSYARFKKLNNFNFLNTENTFRSFGLSLNSAMNANKFKLLRSKFFFAFIKYILSIFNIKVRLILTTGKAFYQQGFTIKLVKLILSDENKIIMVQQLPYFNKNMLIKHINYKLSEYIKLVLLKAKLPNKLIVLLFNKYYNTNFNKFIGRSFNYDLMLMYFHKKMLINRFKFDKFLPGFKSLMAKIYDKHIELNIVNLKHHYLNSEIFLKSLVIKLRKRLGFLYTLRYSLSLVKIPNKFIPRNDIHNINKFDDLNMFKSLNVYNIQKEVKKTDLLEEAIKNTYLAMYSKDAVNTDLYNTNNKDNISKNSDILNQLKFKWITGVRLEAKGRLTRRYTASRSVFKLKIKGNLTNTDFSRKIDNTDKSLPNVFMRNQINSNIQHSYINSKKRIGAFGVKGWMSSY